MNRSQHAGLHQDPRPGAAVLAGVVEHRVRRGGGGPLDVGVGEHDVRALAAEFQGQPLDVAGAAGHDLLADLGRAGEHDLAHQPGGRRGAGRRRCPCLAAPGTRPRAARPPGRARRSASRSAASSRRAWPRPCCRPRAPARGPRTGSASGSSTARSGRRRRAARGTSRSGRRPPGSAGRSAARARRSSTSSTSRTWPASQRGRADRVAGARGLQRGQLVDVRVDLRRRTRAAAGRGRRARRPARTPGPAPPGRSPRRSRSAVVCVDVGYRLLRRRVDHGVCATSCLGSSLRAGALQPLEAAAQLPVGHGGVERGQLDPRVVRVVLDAPRGRTRPLAISLLCHRVRARRGACAARAGWCRRRRCPRRRARAAARCRCRAGRPRSSRPGPGTGSRRRPASGSPAAASDRARPGGSRRSGCPRPSGPTSARSCPARTACRS